MKQSIFLTFLLCLFAAVTFSQGNERIFMKFKGDVSLGYARFSKKADIKNGFIIALEPKFQVLDQLAIGIRVESVLQGDDEKDFDGDDQFKFKAYQSAIGSADYYFTKDYKLRPFIGGGGGLYTVIATRTDSYYTDDDDNGKRKFKLGGMLRAGVEIKHLKIAFEYNFIPNTTYSYLGTNGYVNQTYYNSYFAVKMGFCISGGPYKR